MEWFDWVLIGCIIVFLIWLIQLLQLRNQNLEYRAKFPHAVYCIDGDKVKSLSEKIIDDCLTHHGIIHKYEDFINRDEGKFKYDWFLPEAEIYIEFFGLSTKEYQAERKIKENIYRKHHMNMIPIEPADLDKIEEKLELKIGSSVWNRIVHAKHCPNCGVELY